MDPSVPHQDNIDNNHLENSLSISQNREEMVDSSSQDIVIPFNQSNSISNFEVHESTEEVAHHNTNDNNYDVNNEGISYSNDNSNESANPSSDDGNERNQDYPSSDTYQQDQESTHLNNGDQNQENPSQESTNGRQGRERRHFITFIPTDSNQRPIGRPLFISFNMSNEGDDNGNAFPDIDAIMMEIAMRLSERENRKEYKASQESIDKLARHLIENESSLDFDDNKCSVCLEGWENDQTIFKMPCSHPYHKSCLLPWLGKSHTCPTCRYPLLTEDNEYNQIIRKEIENRNDRMVIHQPCAMSFNGLCFCDLGTFLKNDMVELTCGHYFHPNCIESSLAARHQTITHTQAFKCPSCLKFSMIQNWEQYTPLCHS